MFNDVPIPFFPDQTGLVMSNGSHGHSFVDQAVARPTDLPDLHVICRSSHDPEGVDGGNGIRSKDTAIGGEVEALPSQKRGYPPWTDSFVNTTEVPNLWWSN
jgi:hypothetical protein